MKQMGEFCNRNKMVYGLWNNKGNISNIKIYIDPYAMEVDKISQRKYHNNNNKKKMKSLCYNKK